MPRRSSKPKKYAFFIHPLNLKDVEKKYKIAQKVSPRLVAGVLKRRRPFVLSSITGLKSLTGAEIEGVLIAVPLLPWQFLELEEEYVLKKLVQACKVAEKEGAGLVGLGAYTAIPGNSGKKLAAKVGIGVTTGNTYTVATAIDGALKAAEVMEKKPADSTLVVFGGSGSIGSACVMSLAPLFKRTIAIARSHERLGELAENVKKKTGKAIEVSSELDDIRLGDVVITVSGAGKEMIAPESIKTGAVVCDVARPRDVAEAVAKVREDVLVIDGGVVRAPGNLRFTWDVGLPKGIVLACMAETMMLALEGRFEDYTLGKEISQEMIEETRALAAKHGFELAGLRSFEKVLDEKKIEKVRAAARAAQR